MVEIVENLRFVQERINNAAEKCGRNPSEIKIIAVSKTKPIEDIRSAVAVGLLVFGENRVQEAEGKINELKELNLEWHLVGHLQTNKVKKALPLFHLIHSVDSVKLIQEIEKNARKQDCKMNVLLQLNLSREETKSGTEIENFEKLLAAAKNAEHICVCGLMTLPPFFDDPEEARPYFSDLRKLSEYYQEDLVGSGREPELSMGMTNDYEVAIEEGATMVRIGTAIFGSRDY